MPSPISRAASAMANAIPTQLGIDVTCSCSFLKTYLNKAGALDAIDIINQRAKRNHYAAVCSDLGVHFLAWVLNTMAGMGLKAFWEWLDEMFARAAAIS